MVTLEQTDFLNWRNCLRLANGDVELVVSLEVGPRIICYRTVGGNNFFKVFEEQLAGDDPGRWYNYGGHRLWHAPEVFPRTYYPDNQPLTYEWRDEVLRLLCPVESTTGIQKELVIALDAVGSGVCVNHIMYNRNLWEIEFAPWALSVMASGGRLIVPQEPHVPHGHGAGESLEPARPLVLWQYTKMNDPKFVWGEKYIQLKADERYPDKQKFGVVNKQGWAAYVLGKQTFVKLHPYVAGAIYPDMGCNAEFFTMPGFLEIESLGPLSAVAPGANITHQEQWSIRQASPSEDEIDIAGVRLP